MSVFVKFTHTHTHTWSGTSESVLDSIEADVGDCLQVQKQAGQTWQLWPWSAFSSSTKMAARSRPRIRSTSPSRCRPTPATGWPRVSLLGCISRKRVKGERWCHVCGGCLIWVQFVSWQWWTCLQDCGSGTGRATSKRTGCSLCGTWWFLRWDTGWLPSLRLQVASPSSLLSAAKSHKQLSGTGTWHHFIWGSCNKAIFLT